MVNKINEIEAYAVIDARGKNDADSSAPQRSSRPLTDQDITGDFYIEVFSGSGRLPSALERRLRTAGRHPVRVIRFDVRTNPDDDILRAEAFNRPQSLINSGRCLGVWFAPPCAP